MGALPVSNVPPENLNWAFALSLVTALSAMAVVGLVALKHRTSSIIKLKQTRDRAEAANHAKTEFLSSMSHELRTPMNAILGFAQILKSDTDEPLTPDQRSSVDHILEGGMHLMDLIDQVLDMAKIETGNLTLSFTEVEVELVCLECLQLVDNQARERSLTLTNMLSDTRTIDSDYTRLKQVLLNLLSNAIKYNRAGGTVTLASEDMPGDMIRMTVTDTGTGISTENQNLLFEPFNRLGKEAGDIEGTGIGLTISRQLVEAIGGNIGYKNELAKGSSFWVDLPVFDKTSPQVMIPVEPSLGRESGGKCPQMGLLFT